MTDSRPKDHATLLPYEITTAEIAAARTAVVGSVTAAAQNANAHRHRWDVSRDILAHFLREARAIGVPVTELVTATNLSRARVAQILADHAAADRGHAHLTSSGEP